MQYTLTQDRKTGKFSKIPYLTDENSTVEKRYNVKYRVNYINYLKNIIDQYKDKEDKLAKSFKGYNKFLSDIFGTEIDGVDLQFVYGEINKGAYLSENKLDYSKIKSIYDSLTKDLENAPSIKDFSKLSIAEQNIRAARNNEMLDVMISILNDEKSFEENHTPNSFDNIQDAVAYINGISKKGVYNLNMYKFIDNAALRRLNLNVRNLKANSVGYDGAMSVNGIIGTTLRPDLANVMKYDLADLPKGTTLTTLKNRYGKGNVKTNTDNEGNIVGYTIDHIYVANNAEGDWLNIHGEKISLQEAEITSNILDAVNNNPLFSNFKEESLALYRMFIATGACHYLNGKSNSHIYAGMFIQQPVVIAIVKNMKSREGLLVDENKFQAIDYIKRQYQTRLYQLLRTEENKIKSFDEAIDKGNYIYIDSPHKKNGNYESIRNWFDTNTNEQYNFSSKPHSLSELEKNLKDAATLKDASDEEKKSFYINQLNVLEDFIDKYNTAKAISDSVQLFSADKKTATTESTTKLKLSINESIFDVKDIVEQLYGQGASAKEVNDAITEFNNLHSAKEKYDWLNTNGIKSSKLYSGGTPLSVAVYPKYFEQDNESVYPSFQSYLFNGQLLAEELLSKYMIQNSPVYTEFIHRLQVSLGVKTNDGLENRIKSYLTNYYINQSTFFGRNTTENLDERKRVLGYEPSNKEDIDAVNLNSNAKKSVNSFNSLTLFDKLDLLQDDPKVKKYINNTKFYGQHILGMIGIKETKSEDKTKIRKYLDFDYNGEVKHVSNSLMDMYYSKNPYLSSVARDLVKYAFYNNGFSFGKNISKVISPYLYYGQDNIGYKDAIESIFNKSTNIDNYDSIVTEDFLLDFHRAFATNSVITPRLSKTLRKGKDGMFVDKRKATYSTIVNEVIIEDSDLVDKDRKIKNKEFVSRFDSKSKEIILYKKLSNKAIENNGLDTDYTYFIPVSRTLANEFGSTVREDFIKKSESEYISGIKNRYKVSDKVPVKFITSKKSSFMSIDEENIKSTDTTITFDGYKTNAQKKSNVEYKGKTADVISSNIVKSVNSLHKDEVKINFVGGHIFELEREQDSLNEAFTSIFEMIKGNKDLKATISEIRVNNNTGIAQAVAIGASRNGFNVVVNQPSNLVYKVSSSKTEKEEGTARYEAAESITPEEPQQYELAKRDTVVKYLGTKIVSWTKLANKYTHHQKASFTKDLGKLKEQYEKDFSNTIGEEGSYAQMKRYNNDVILRGLTNDYSFTRKSIDYLKKRIDYYKTQNLYELYKDKSSRDEFINAMKNISDLLTISNDINLLDEIYLEAESSTNSDKEINKIISDLKGMIGELNSLRNSWNYLYTRFLLNGVLQTSTNPIFKNAYEKYKDADTATKYVEEVALLEKFLNENEDITTKMYYLDTVFETGIPSIDNLLQEINTSKFAQHQELNSTMRPFRKLFTEVFGEYNRKSVDAISKKFIDLYVERDANGEPTGRLLSKFNFTKFLDDRDKHFTKLKEREEQFDKDVEVLADTYGKKSKEYTTEYNKLNAKKKAEDKADWKDWESNHVEKVLVKGTNDKLYNELKVKEEQYESALFEEYLKSKDIRYDEYENDYYFYYPNEQYQNDRYSKLVFLKDGVETALNKEGEFYILMKKMFADAISFSEAAIIRDNFLPSIPDWKRTDLDSFLIYMGLKDMYNNNEIQIGTNNELINVVRIQGLQRLHKREPIFISKQYTTETTNEYKTRVLQEVNNRNIYNSLGKEFTSYEDIISHNEDVRKENEKFNRENISYDIYSIMENFLAGAIHHKYQQKLRTTLENGIEAISSNFNVYTRDADNKLYFDKLKQAFTKKREPHKISASESKAIGRVKQFVNTELNNVDVDSRLAKKLLRPLIQFTSLRTMGGNITAGLKNVMMGYSQMVIEAGGRRFLTQKELNKGRDLYIKHVHVDMAATRGTRRAGNLDAAFCRLFNSLLELQDERGVPINREIKNAMDRALMLVDGSYIFNNSGEHFMQFAMLLGMLNAAKVIDGQIVTRNEYIQDRRKEIIEKYLTAEQKKDLNQFMDNYRTNNIHKFGKGNELTEWLQGADLTRDQRQKYSKEVKDSIKTMSTEFDSYSSLYDEFEFTEGEAILKEGSSITFDQLARFEEKVRAINQSMHGIYDKLNKNYIQSYLWGQALFQFRKWMVPTWNRWFGIRTGGSQWSERTGDWNKGIYTSAFEFLGSPKRRNPLGILHRRGEGVTITKAFKNIIHDYLRFFATAKSQWQFLDEYEKSNIRKAAYQLAMITTVAVMLGILAGIKGDDDEPGFAYSALVYELNSYYTELLSPVPVVGWYQNAKMFMDYPVASEKTLIDLWKLSYHTLSYPFADEESIYYQGGSNKGKMKLSHDVKALIPLYREIYKLENMPMYVNFYKMYNPLIFW